MVKGVTKSGFEFNVDENSINDMRVLDAIAGVDDGSQPLAMSFLTSAILGEKGKKALYEHVAESDGRVPINKVADIIAEIIGALGNAGKNS